MARRRPRKLEAPPKIVKSSTAFHSIFSGGEFWESGPMWLLSIGSRDDNPVPSPVEGSMIVPRVDSTVVLELLKPLKNLQERGVPRRGPHNELDPWQGVLFA